MKHIAEAVVVIAVLAFIIALVYMAHHGWTLAGIF